MDGYQELANAVIIQAVKDYERALLLATGKGRSNTLKKAERKLNELREFFNSKWCNILSEGTDIDLLVERVETRFWAKIFGFENDWDQSKVLRKCNGKPNA